MKNALLNRRNFIKDTAKVATGLALFSTLPEEIIAETMPTPSRIKFSVININHGHIYGMVEAVTRGGGELVSFYAKEPDLVAAFAKRYPTAKLAKSKQEILENPDIQLIMSSGIPIERAPLGIEVFQRRNPWLI